MSPMSIVFSMWNRTVGMGSVRIKHCLMVRAMEEANVEHGRPTTFDAEASECGDKHEARAKTSASRVDLRNPI